MLWIFYFWFLYSTVHENFDQILLIKNSILTFNFFKTSHCKFVLHFQLCINQAENVTKAHVWNIWINFFIFSFVDRKQKKYGYFFFLFLFPLDKETFIDEWKNPKRTTTRIYIQENKISPSRKRRTTKR